MASPTESPRDSQSLNPSTLFGDMPDTDFWNCDLMSNTVDPSILVESHHESLPTLDSLPQAPRAYNTRASLPRRRSRYCLSRSNERAVPIPVPHQRGLDPMQRWQESPPEDEPASLTAIMNAVDEMPSGQQSSRHSQSSSPANAFGGYRKPSSITSGEYSASSAESIGSSAGRSTPQSSQSRRSRGRVTKKSKPKPWNDGKPRPFCCTFCCDRFRSKYDWVRHEKSLHLTLETWFCAPLGPSAFSQVTGRQHCVFCDIADPAPDHFSKHIYDECQKLSQSNRSFRRKDHLVQHLRHFHHVDSVPLIDEWKVETKDITSRCGFCNQNLIDWNERIEHLGDHFRKGLTMKDWQGDHGFPPSITAQLRNAFPPYLIGAESESLIPFSPTNADVRDHYAQMSTRVQGANPFENTRQSSVINALPDQSKLQFDNFLGNFTRHLGQYARHQMEAGIIPTDEMFQQEARRVIFDCEDAWDQTIADDPRWLSSFRQLHCENDETAPNS